MRNALTLSAVVSLAALSFGCAVTDYAVISEELNKSHGIVGCTNDDRFANAQQTVERQTRSLLLAAKDPVTGATICPGGFNPALTTDTVGAQDARDWNRFNAIYAFFNEAQVFGTGPLAGTWAMAGVKDLQDGSRRINTYYAPGTGAFSCVGAAVGGRYGGPEGAVAGDGYAQGGAAPRIPGWGVETVAVDASPGNTSEFCSNVAATTPARAGAGFSSLWSLGRGFEGRIPFTPVTRHEGLAEFFNGGQLTVTVEGVSVTGHAAVGTDGRITAYLDGLEADGVAYRAETPVSFVVDPARGLRTIEVHPDGDELRRLAQFALEADLVDREIRLGKFVPALGVTLPDASFVLVGDTVRRLATGDGSVGEGGGGFGG